MSRKPVWPDLVCRREAPDVLSCRISSVPASSLSGQAGEVVGVDYISQVWFPSLALGQDVGQEQEG